MPIVVSACARSSSSPSSVAIANAASARRRPSSVSPAISRMRAEKARTRGRRGRDRVAGEILRAREMLEDGVVLTSLPEDAREERLRLGCALRVADRQQRVSRGLERLLLPCDVVGPDGARRQAGTAGRAARRLCGQSASASSYCAAATAKLLRANARSPAARRASRVRSTSSSSSLPDARTSSSAERQWYASISAWSSGRPRPSIHSATPRCLCARSARGNLAVRRRRERARARMRARLSPSTDERRWRRTKPFRSSEWSEPCRGCRLAADGAGPEDLPDDGCVLEQALLRSGQPVEARRDDALERLGKRELLGRALLEVQLGELLGVERVAARALEQRLLDVGGKQRAVEQVPDQRGGLLVGQRRERERRGVELAAAPVRAALEQLGPRRGDDEQRDVGHPVDELVDEVEQALVRPVESSKTRTSGRCSASSSRKRRQAAKASFRRSPPSSDSSSSPAERARGDATRPTSASPELPTSSSTALAELLARCRSRRPARGCRPAP